MAWVLASHSDFGAQSMIEKLSRVDIALICALTAGMGMVIRISWLAARCVKKGHPDQDKKLRGSVNLHQT